MNFNVKGTLRPLQRATTLTQKQLRFATENTLTKVAFRGRRFSRIKAQRELNQPTRRTLGGVRYRNARRTMVSSVYWMPHVWRYLRWQVLGGTQRFNPRRLVPMAKHLIARQTKQGALTPATIRALLANPNTRTVGAKKNVLIDNSKRARGARLLGFWIRAATYRPRFRWYQHMQHVVRTWIVKDFNTQVRRELRRVGVK